MLRVKSGILGGGLFGCLILSACGGGGGAAAPVSSAPPPTTSTVNLVVTDTPSTKVTILSFQVEITGAVLQPGNVALLPRPVTVDLAQLVSDTSLLTSAVIGSATYTSLEMTFANPQVTLLNNTGATLSLKGQSCAAAATCTYVPTLNNATVTVSSGVFPVTVTASSATGIAVDLSIPDLLQSDLSITFASGSSVNLSLLSGQSAAAQQALIGDVVASVTSVDGNQVKVMTAFGDSLVLSQSGTTAYYYPTAVCASAGSACLAAGQVVTLDLSLLGSGALGIDSVSYLGAQGAQFTKALVLGTNLTTAIPTAQVLLRRSINVSSLTAGAIATVSLPSTASYAIGATNVPAVSATFASGADVMAGQELILGVGSDLVAGTAPTFSASAVYLEPSQLVGAVNAVDTASSTVALSGLSGLFSESRPVVQLVDVQAGASTQFVGSASLSALTAGQFIVAKGPLFRTGSSYPVVAAQLIGARPVGN